MIYDIIHKESAFTATINKLPPDTQYLLLPGIYYNNERVEVPRAMRNGREKGRGRKEKGDYHVTPNLSRCRESVFVVQIHRRFYHVTPDLRWHGQQLPYSNLYVSTKYSTSVDGILSHKLLETICFITHTYALIAVVVSTRYNKHTLHHIFIIQRPCLNKQLIIFRFADVISPKQQSNYPEYQILLFGTEVNYIFYVDGDTKIIPLKPRVIVNTSVKH